MLRPPPRRPPSRPPGRPPPPAFPPPARCASIPLVKAAPVEAREVVHARPTFRREAALWRAGFRLIAGVDEVGRGPLAGPVVAAAVVLPARARLSWPAPALGPQPPERIDELGIAVAGRLAMAQALAALDPAAEYALIDAFTLAS